jgi:parallel beta-helix repeat protein
MVSNQRPASPVVNATFLLLSYILLCFAGFGDAAAAATVAGQTITANTVWTLVDSPYTITGTVRVASGATLAIEPGVELTFDPNAALLVDGTLQAAGTDLVPIVFKATEAGAWGGISFRSGATGGVLSHARISGAATCVYLANAEAEVSHGLLRRCTYGVHLSGSNALVSHNRIEQNGAGIYVSSGAPRVEHNLVVENSGSGVYVSSGARPALLHNTIDGNGGTGLNFADGNSNTTLVRDNLVTRNQTGWNYGFYATRDHNNVWGNHADYASSASGGSGSLSVDPIYTGSDYRLDPSSPLLTASSDGQQLGAYGGDSQWPEPGHAPVANAGSDQSVNAGVVLQFAGSFTDSDSGDTHAVTWDFGDSGSASGTLTPQHAYAAAGIYTVTLTVRDSSGLQGTDTLTVTVSAPIPAPTASINAINPAKPVVGDPIEFSGSAGPADQTIDLYYWSIAKVTGGIESSQRLVIGSSPHFFTDEIPAGQWRVHLQVRNSLGGWSPVASADITVADDLGVADLAVNGEAIRYLDVNGDPVANPLQGDMVTVQVDVANLGDTETGNEVTLLLYDGDEISGTVVGSATVHSIPAHGATTMEIPWHVGYDATGAAIPGYQDGYKLLTAKVDYSANLNGAMLLAAAKSGAATTAATVAEKTTSNNVSTSYQRVGTPPPDTYGINVQLMVPGTLYAGSEVTIFGYAHYQWGHGWAVKGAQATVQFEAGVPATTRTKGTEGLFVRTISLPSTPGTYQLTVRVDDRSLQGAATAVLTVTRPPTTGEWITGSGGSGGSASSTPPPLPVASSRDLQVTNIAWSGSGVYTLEMGGKAVTRGSSVSVEATIRNPGNLPINEPFSVAFYDGNPEASGALIGTASVTSGVAAGGKVTVASPVAWVASADGTHNIYAIADSENAITDELNEYNNTNHQSISVRPARPDLRPYQRNPYPVTGLHYSGPDANGGVKLSVDVYNVGQADYPDDFQVNFYWSSAAVGRTLIGSAPVSGGLPRGAQKTTEPVAWDTKALSPGAYTLYAEVQTPPGSEDFATNNETSRSFSIYTEADGLWPIDITFSTGSPTLGARITINALVQNKSSQLAPSDTLEVYFGDPAAGGQIIGSVQTGEIAGNDTRRLAVGWNTPATADTYRIYARIQGHTQYRNLSVSATPPPNLRVFSEDIIYTPATPQPGDQLNLAANVHNLGATDAINAKVMFIIDDGITARRLGSNVTVPTIPAGGVVRVEATEPLSLDAPFYAFEVLLIPNESQGDGNYSDNSATRALGVGVPPVSVQVIGPVFAEGTLFRPHQRVRVQWSASPTAASDEIVIGMKRVAAANDPKPDGVNWYRFKEGNPTDNDGEQEVEIPEGLAEADDWQFYVRHVSSAVFAARPEKFRYMDGRTLTVNVSGNLDGTVQANPPGTACGDGCQVYAPGTSVTLTAHPNQGFEFGGWTGNACNGAEAVCTVNLNANVTVSAAFQPLAAGNPVLTVALDPNPGGTVYALRRGTVKEMTCTEGPCSRTFQAGTEITLFSYEAYGYHANGWTGCPDVVDERTCRLSLQTSTSVSAHFSPNTVSELEVVDPACSTVDDCRGEDIMVGISGRAVPVNDLAKLVRLPARRSKLFADGVTPLLLRMRSDSAVTFSLPLRDGGQPAAGTLVARDGSNPGTSIRAEPEETPYGKYAFALYLAPSAYPGNDGYDTQWDVNYAEQWVYADVDGQGAQTQTHARFHIYRPPVFLIHGLWSSQGTWINPCYSSPVRKCGLRNFLQQRGYFVRLIDHSDILGASGSFDPFLDSRVVNRLVDSLESVRLIYHRLGFAITQVDVVGHSMGGLIARSLVAYKNRLYRNSGNLFQGDIHRLITIGTPHYGSELAEWLTDNGDTIARTVLLNTGRQMGPGVAELRPNSQALANIGVTNVLSHVLVGHAPPSSGTEKILNTLLLGTSIDELLGDDHDTIVSSVSQSGGLDGTAVADVFGVVHAVFPPANDRSETTDPEVWNQVLVALAAPAGTSAFANLPTPSPYLASITTLAPSQSKISLQKAASVQSFDAPSLVVSASAGSSAYPGETVTLNLTVTGLATVSRALFLVGDAIYQAQGDGPYESVVTMPNRLGPVQVAGVIADGNGQPYLATIELKLVSHQPITEIMVKQDGHVFTDANASLPIHISALASDGSELTLDRADDAVDYRTESGTEAVVRVSKKGEITPVANGVDGVVVEYAGLSTTIPVEVKITNSRPALKSVAPISLQAGESFTLHLTAPDPEGDAVTLTGNNLSAFAQLIEEAPGSSTLVLSPGPADVGAWQFSVTALDDGSPAMGSTAEIRVNVSAAPVQGDLDGDGDVDMNDLNVVRAALNTSASGASDPRDLDGDGKITALDYRQLSLKCSRPRCATQ